MSARCPSPLPGCLLGLFASLALPLAAQNPDQLEQLDLEQLGQLRVDTVVSASRFVQKEIEAPASVTIVSAEEIRDFGYASLAELLGGVRGLYLNNDHAYTYLGSRGFNQPGDYNSRSLFLVNGHRFNDNIYDGVVMDLGSPLDLALIDRVEIIRGPGSSLYGASAFFGVINVITRTGADLGRGETAVEIGTLGHRAVRATAGHKLGAHGSFLVSASLADSDGQDDLDLPRSAVSFAPGRNDHRDTDFQRSRSFYASARQGPVTGEVLYTSRTKGIPGGNFGSLVGDPATRGADTRGYARLSYHDTPRPELTLEANLAYDHYAYDGCYLFDGLSYGLPQPVITVRDWAIGDSLSANLQATRVFAGRHTLIFGLEARTNYRQRQGNEVIDPHQVNFSDASSSRFWSPFAQLEWRPHRQLLFNLGLRHDNYSTFGGTTNPRAALIALLTDRTTLKAVTGTAFRAPNVYELRYNDGGTNFKPSHDLGPERIATAELALEHRFGAASNLSCSLYNYDITRLIAQTLDPADNLLVFRNNDRAHTRGAEFGLTTRLAADTTVDLGLSYQDAHLEGPETPLAYSPHRLGHLRVHQRFFQGRLHASWETRHVSSRLNSRGENAPAVTLHHLTLRSTELLPGLQVRLVLNNLFATRYSDPAPDEIPYATVPQPGRTARLLLEYRY